MQLSSLKEKKKEWETSSYTYTSILLCVLYVKPNSFLFFVETTNLIIIWEKYASKSWVFEW